MYSEPPCTQDVGEALKRLPQQEQDLRVQRLKRAADCGLKKQYLSKEMQAKQTPFDFYLKVAFCCTFACSCKIAG